MRPARFVTYCLLYSGAVLIAQVLVATQFQLNIESVLRAGVGLTILFTGLIRLRKPEKEERKPTEYGPLAYGMAGLALVITAIFLAQLFISI